MTTRAAVTSPTAARIWSMFSLVLALAIGGCVGWISRSYQQPSEPVSIVEDTRLPDATVDILGIRNGALEGLVRGNVRLVVGGDIVVPDGNGEFSYGDSAFLVNRIEVTVPEGMLFLASQRGTRYYPVNSAQGSNIVPENRVYFATEAEAKAAGFKAWNE